MIPAMMRIEPAPDGYRPSLAVRTFGPALDWVLRRLKGRLIAKWNRERPKNDPAADLVRVWRWGKRLQTELIGRQLLAIGDRDETTAAVKGLMLFLSNPPLPVTADIDARLRAVRRVAVIRPGVEVDTFNRVIYEALI